jgi:hypothetical protein
MIRNAETRRGLTGGFPKDQQGGGSVLTVARSEVNRERARWHMVLGSIRAQLDEQPSRRARLAAARRWCAAIAEMALCGKGPQ